MVEAMQALRERAGQLKEKRPGYGAVIDFYVRVREAQAALRASLRIAPVTFEKKETGLPAEEAPALLGKHDFPIDPEASLRLFERLCRLGSKANPHLAAQVEKIDRALLDRTLDLTELLAGGGKEATLERVAAQRGLDAQVLSFLVRSSTLPSIEAGREQLNGTFDPQTPKTRGCPVCGSKPTLSLLKADGARSSLCSWCGCQWRIDRLSCSVCGNQDHAALHYFYGEGETAQRIDLCDRCHHYIKTIDCRTIEGSDPVLEDLASLHLDLLAVEKGYARVVANPWSD